MITWVRPECFNILSDLGREEKAEVCMGAGLVRKHIPCQKAAVKMRNR